jgi:hypothetical protein
MRPSKAGRRELVPSLPVRRVEDPRELAEVHQIVTSIEPDHVIEAFLATLAVNTYALERHRI